MRALVNPQPGVLELGVRPDPVPGAGQVAVRIHAAGVNRADLLQRVGKYAAPPGWAADIPGMEYAGEVIGTGSGVTRWRNGDRVMGLAGGGAHAEQVVVDQRETMAIPSGVPFDAAAAIPEAFLTAWDALVLRGRATVGDRVLFHAIGSGVGTAAAQLGRILQLLVIGTSRTADKLERCRALGMTHGVLTTDADWPGQVGGPVTVVIDTLGAAAFGQNLKLLARRGRLVILGTMTGGVAHEIDLSLVLRQRLEIIGTAMRGRPIEERDALVARFSAEILPEFARGTLKAVVDQVLPFEHAAQAYDLLQSNGTFGKVVLRW